MFAALIEDGLVTNVIVVANQSDIALFEGYVKCPKEVAIGWLYDGITFNAPTVEIPEPELVIPDRLSRRQFRLALIDAGLIEQVEGWVATQDIRTQAAYADSSTFLRTDEMLQQGFAGLGFSQAQVDEFFTAASTL